MQKIMENPIKLQIIQDEQTDGNKRWISFFEKMFFFLRKTKMRNWDLVAGDQR